MSSDHHQSWGVWILRTFRTAVVGVLGWFALDYIELRQQVRLNQEAKTSGERAAERQERDVRELRSTVTLYATEMLKIARRLRPRDPTLPREGEAPPRDFPPTTEGLQAAQHALQELKDSPLAPRPAGPTDG